MFAAEMDGILAWAVRGCLSWLHQGIQSPPEVRAATRAYRADMDDLQQFLDSCCVVGKAHHILATPLYAAYRAWNEEQGVPRVITQTMFAGRLKDRGFHSERTKHGNRWVGLDLRPDDFTDPAPPPTNRPNPG